jgi:endonuclease/exonuclease/phosphatase family metal-dependent hydrolase
MRVLSYNIHKGIGGRDRRYRLERIIDVITHEQPDVICLQEVDRHVRRSRLHNQPELLAERFQSVGKLYQLNVPVSGGGYGNLLLSRWPFLEQHQISLTLRKLKPRGAQWAVIATPAGEVRIVNWHLGLAERERHWQVRRLLEHHLFRSSAHLPTLVIGDTNDWRNTLARGPFAVHGYHQATAPPSRFRSFPAYFPLGSLDKAFTRGPLVIEHARVARTKLARDASDHLPLVIDFELTTPTASRSLPQAPM